MLLFHSLLLCLLFPADDPGIEADFVLRGATLVDGTGTPSVKGDLAIKGERIVAVGRVAVAGKPRFIDASALMVAPGFIDLHTHSDDALTEAQTRDNLNYLRQGVTTVVTGNCGFGPTNVADYFAKMEKGSVGSNVLHLVPHNSVRRAVMKNANRPPSEAELKKMADLVEPRHDRRRLGPVNRPHLQPRRLCEDGGADRAGEGELPGTAACTPVIFVTRAWAS